MLLDIFCKGRRLQAVCLAVVCVVVVLEMYSGLFFGSKNRKKPGVLALKQGPLKGPGKSAVLALMQEPLKEPGKPAVLAVKQGPLKEPGKPAVLAVKQGPLKEPGKPAVLAVKQGPLKEPGKSAVLAVKQGPLKGPGKSAVLAVKQGLLKEPGKSGVLAVKQGPLKGPGKSAVLAVKQGPLKEPGKSAVLAVKQGPLKGPGKSAVLAVKQGPLKGPGKSAVLAVKQGPLKGPGKSAVLALMQEPLKEPGKPAVLAVKQGPLKGPGKSAVLAVKQGPFLGPVLRERCHEDFPDIRLPDNVTFISSCYMPQRSIPGPKKRILFFNRLKGFFGASQKDLDNAFRRCGDACQFTDNRSLIGEVDAVMVHMGRIYDQAPPRLPSPNPRLVWVAFGGEAPHGFLRPYANRKWRGVFNWTMYYRMDSDILAPYGFLAVRSRLPDKNYTALALGKRKAVAWFVNNCRVPSRRGEYVQELSRHIDVDVYGKCGQLKSRRSRGLDKDLLTSTYFFYLSFESALCQDYVTEKLFKIYDGIDIVPVVWGAVDYARYFPPNTFINTADFPSPRRLAGYLKSLMADRRAYSDMLRAKDRFDLQGHPDPMCSLCRALHQPTLPRRHYPDLGQWVERGCRRPRDLHFPPE